MGTYKGFPRAAAGATDKSELKPTPMIMSLNLGGLWDLRCLQLHVSCFDSLPGKGCRL